MRFKSYGGTKNSGFSDKVTIIVIHVTCTGSFDQQCRSGLKLVTLKRGKNDRTEKRISSPMKVKSKV